MVAIVIGATGATGTALVNLLLNDSRFSQVITFTRKKIAFTNPQLTNYVIDFNNVSSWQHLVKGDILFSCLGTTIKDAGSKEAQWQIDYEYQYQFAVAAQKNKVPAYVLVSAIDAAANSKIFYSSMKGQLENAVQKLNFSKTIIAQPSLLIRENTKRPMEIVSYYILSFLNALGLFLKYKPIQTQKLAKVLIKNSVDLPNGFYKLTGNELLKN